MDNTVFWIMLVVFIALSTFTGYKKNRPMLGLVLGLLLNALGLLIMLLVPKKKTGIVPDTKDGFICTTCGHVSEPETRVKGSFAVELALWLCFLLPGLIYSVWRLSNKVLVCPACGKDTIVSTASPIGQKLLKELT